MGYSKVVVNSNKVLRCINIDDIIFIESEGPYAEIYLKNLERIVVSKTLKKIEQRLCDFGFIRINRSVLININHITKIRKPRYEVMLTGEVKFIVSIRYKTRLLRVLKTNLIKL